MRRVLLDENLPGMLAKELPGFEVRTVTEAGWKGVKNGELLRRAAGEYDVFISGDRGIPHQHNTRALDLGIIILAVGSTKLDDLRPLAPILAEAIAAVRPGQLVYVPSQ